MSAYLQECFRLVGLWLAETGAKGNLHLEPREMTRSLTNKLMARLRQAEELIRKLIWLLATEIEPAPTQPRSRASSADRLPRPHHWSFRIVHYGSYNAAQLDAFAARTERPAPPPPRIGLLLDRYRRLSALALDPQPAARRLAKRLRVMRAARGLPLLTMPMQRTYRLPAELGLMASFLPREVNDAMRAYFDTG